MKSDYKTGILNLRWEVQTVLMLPVCVAVNFLGYFLCGRVEQIPLCLMNVGTFLGAFIGGPVYAVIVGIAARTGMLLMTESMQTPVFLLSLFYVTGIGMAMGFAVRLGFVRSWKKATYAGIFVGVIAALIQFPASVALNGGAIADNRLFDILVSALLAQTHGILQPAAVFLGRLLADVTDMIVTVWIVYALLRLLPEFWQKYFHVEKFQKKIELVEKTPETEPSKNAIPLDK